MQNRAVRTVNWREISKNNAAEPAVQDQQQREPETREVIPLFSLQSGASYLSQGFEDNVLGSSPG